MLFRSVSQSRYHALYWRDIDFAKNGTGWAVTEPGKIYRKLTTDASFIEYADIGPNHSICVYENTDETHDVYVFTAGGSVLKNTGGSGSFALWSSMGQPTIWKVKIHPQGYFLGIRTDNSDLMRLNIDASYSTVYSGTVSGVAISQSGDIYIIEDGYLKKSIDEGVTFSNVIATSATNVDIGRDGKIYLYDASTISSLS